MYDYDGMFHKPIAESYPEVAESYLAEIKTPMDFSTIRNERLKKYRVVSDLQNDLILVFRNCCTFNDPTSDYGEHAM